MERRRAPTCLVSPMTDLEREKGMKWGREREGGRNGKKKVTWASLLSKKGCMKEKEKERCGEKIISDSRKVSTCEKEERGVKGYEWERKCSKLCLSCVRWWYDTILKELFLSERKCEVKSTFMRKNEREEEEKREEKERKERKNISRTLSTQVPLRWISWGEREWKVANESVT